MISKDFIHQYFSHMTDSERKAWNHTIGQQAIQAQPCMIGEFNRDRTITYIICYNNSDFRAGEILAQYYYDPKKVHQLIQKGDIHCLKNKVENCPSVKDPFWDTDPTEWDSQTVNQLDFFKELYENCAMGNFSGGYLFDPPNIWYELPQHIVKVL